MTKLVSRRRTLPTKPPGVVDAARKGRCGWCIDGLHEKCNYWWEKKPSFLCPCPCPTKES